MSLVRANHFRAAHHKIYLLKYAYDFFDYLPKLRFFCF